MLTSKKISVKGKSKRKNLEDLLQKINLLEEDCRKLSEKDCKKKIISSLGSETIRPYLPKMEKIGRLKTLQKIRENTEMDIHFMTQKNKLTQLKKSLKKIIGISTKEKDTDEKEKKKLLFFNKVLTVKQQQLNQNSNTIINLEPKKFFQSDLDKAISEISKHQESFDFTKIKNLQLEFSDSLDSVTGIASYEKILKPLFIRNLQENYDEWMTNHKILFDEITQNVEKGDRAICFIDWFNMFKYFCFSIDDKCKTIDKKDRFQHYTFAEKNRLLEVNIHTVLDIITKKILAKPILLIFSPSNNFMIKKLNDDVFIIYISCKDNMSQQCRTPDGTKFKNEVDDYMLLNTLIFFRKYNTFLESQSRSILHFIQQYMKPFQDYSSTLYVNEQTFNEKLKKTLLQKIPKQNRLFLIKEDRYSWCKTNYSQGVTIYKDL
jgi:hypothetical protein